MTRATYPDLDDSPMPMAPRELDSRVGDGIHVQLLWHPDDGHVSVAVDDAKTGETFELAVCHGQRALDVLHRELIARELAARFAHQQLGPES